MNDPGDYIPDDTENRSIPGHERKESGAGVQHSGVPELPRAPQAPTAGDEHGAVPDTEAEKAPAKKSLS